MKPGSAATLPGFAFCGSRAAVSLCGCNATPTSPPAVPARGIMSPAGNELPPGAGQLACYLPRQAGRWTVSEGRSEEHTSELQSQSNLVCRLLLEKKKNYDSERMT